MVETPSRFARKLQRLQQIALFWRHCAAGDFIVARLKIYPRPMIMAVCGFGFLVKQYAMMPPATALQK
jgi:hypothetical protein